MDLIKACHVSAYDSCIANKLSYLVSKQIKACNIATCIKYKYVNTVNSYVYSSHTCSYVHA